MKLPAKAQDRLDQMVSRLRAGDLAPIRQVLTLEIDPRSPCLKWSGSNRMMAALQSDELDHRGFQQWRDAGRQVRKGARAVYIWRPKTIAREDDAGDKKTILIGFAPLAVFGASDTIPTPGHDAPLTPYTPRVLPPLAAVAARLGCTLTYAPLIGARGLYRPYADHIALATHDQKTLAHELAHAAHARVLRARGETLEPGQDPHQEIVADLCAAVLMDIYELGDYSGNAWKYINAYAPDDPLSAISAALRDIADVLGLILATEATL
jgi:hypothetical protein